MAAPITAVYAGLCALVILVLVGLVERQRFRHRVEFGDGGQIELARAIRAHANALENIPLALVLLLLWELAGAPPWGLHLAGVALVASRVLHGWGLNRSSGRSMGRAAGAVGSWMVIFGLALALLGHALLA